MKNRTDQWEIPKGKKLSEIGRTEMKQMAKEYKQTIGNKPRFTIRQIQHRHRVKWPHMISKIVQLMGGRLRKSCNKK